MNSTETKYFDFVLQVARHVDGSLHSALHMSREQASELGDEWLKDLLLQFKGDYYEENNLYGNLCLESDKLDTEIRLQFMSHADSRLQDRFANYLMTKIEHSLLPLYFTITSTIEEFSQQPYEKGNPFETAGFGIFAMMKRELYSWIYVIQENVRMFAPERYAARSRNMTLPEYDEHGDEIPLDYTPHIQESTEPGIKGQWKNLPPKILLLEKLGFFQLPEVLKLGWEAKGKLVSTLCGGSADNAVDYIRHCDPERTALGNNPYRNPKNVNAVEDLLNLLNKDL